MQYKMMIPPFKTVKFWEMNKKQAEEYFEWFISQIDYRISLILNAAMEDGIDYCFDYSVESLIPLWDWYENKITYRKLSESEYQSLLNDYPEWIRDFIPTSNLSFETLMYCSDLAIYFAQVIIKNNSPKISWGYFTKPKNRANVNEPTLLGFKYDKDLNPRVIVENCTRRSGREKSSTRLYDMYNIWMEYI